MSLLLMTGPVTHGGFFLRREEIAKGWAGIWANVKCGNPYGANANESGTLSIGGCFVSLTVFRDSLRVCVVCQGVLTSVSLLPPNHC